MAHPGRGVPAPIAEAPGPIAPPSEPPRSAAVASWSLVTLAVLSPWAFGGVTPAGVHTVTTLSLVIAFAVALHQGWRGGLWLPPMPLWPLAILIAIGLLQLVPLPAGVHSLVAAGSAGLWHPADPAAAAFLEQGRGPISIHPAATSAWVGMAGGLSALALLAAPALIRRRRMIRAAWILVAAGAAVAIYGIVARAVFGSLLYGSIAVPTVAPFGPFVNKNHFAGFVEMPALLALGLGRGLWRQTASASDSGAAAPRPTVLVAFAAAAAMVMAILLSMSRGGALGLVSGVAIFAVIDVATSRHRAPTSKALGVVALAAVLAVVAAVLPGEVHERLFGGRWRDDRSAIFRMETWKDSVRAWRSSPLLGQGMGAFADVLPRYKTTAGAFRVEHPENEIIEIAVEGGLVALAAAAIVIVGGLVRVVRAIRGHRDRVVRGIVTGAVAGMAALAVHGLVDFNLRIPSNAILFVALAALAVAPLGPVTWRGPERWGFVALLAVVALTYSTKSDSSPLLREARALAVKAQQSQQQGGGAALRASMADRRVREYVRRRPADPEGWLLAAWTTAMRGNADEGAALARYAITLDPERVALGTAARDLIAVKSSR